MNVVIESRMKDIYRYIGDILMIGKSKLIIIKLDEQVVQDKIYLIFKYFFKDFCGYTFDHVIT